MRFNIRTLDSLGNTGVTSESVGLEEVETTLRNIIPELLEGFTVQVTAVKPQESPEASKVRVVGENIYDVLVQEGGLENLSKGQAADILVEAMRRAGVVK